MEVEARVLSSFNLNPGNIPAFSFSDMSGALEEARGLREVIGKMSENDGELEAAAAPESPSAALAICPSNAAMKLQKAYRGYRTRRMLADSAVVAEELWWQALDFARLNHSTISFFNFLKPETAASRWNRVRLNASKVGKGLSKDAKAQKLAFQHWIEAELDLGDGKEVDLKDCPRSKLREQCIKYLGPKERQHYEYYVADGKIIHKLTGEPLDTNKGSSESKWIFVMSTSKGLYTGVKKKGLFHHSSFLAGGATLAAGRLIAEGGMLKCISAYSGHYKPTDESLETFLSFLKENGVNLDEVEIRKTNDDYESNESGELYITSQVMLSDSDSIPREHLPKEEVDLPSETTDRAPHPETKTEYKRTLSGGLRSPKAEVPKKAMLQRINSKKVARSYQLGHQLSTRWSTGAGPRIGCVADYPVELRLQALELTNLSPRTGRPPLFSPRKVCNLVLCPSPAILANGDSV
ncbi:IQ domain-containing protein iqm3 [Orobanche minor]